MRWIGPMEQREIGGARPKEITIGLWRQPLLTVLAGSMAVAGCIELQQALYPPHPVGPDPIVFFDELDGNGNEPATNENNAPLDNENGNLSENDNANLNDNANENDNLSDGIPPLPPGVPLVPTNTGLQIAEIQTGSGDFAALDAEIVVNYTGWLLSDESVFCMQAGATFVLGELIQGWQEGILTMREGGIRRLIIPPNLAYGADGRPGIPPNSTLVFDIELIEVN